MTPELTLFAWMVVTLLDLGLTYEGLSRGFQEKNPVVRWVIERYGTHMMCIVNFVFSMAVGIDLSPFPSILAVLIALRGMVSIWNAAQIVRYDHHSRKNEED